MAASQKVHVILTKYFMYINQGHNVIYLQNIQFERLTVRPGGAYTDATHGTKCKIFVNVLKTFIIFVLHKPYKLFLGYR